ncbi:MAG: hypothetical protein AB7O62_17795 [Pirellulales bacterium]
MKPLSNEPREAAAAVEPPADEMILRLKCPQCGAGGRVAWNSLRHGMKCHKCGCQFMIGSDGKLVSQDALPRVRFDCPRCGSSGQMLAPGRCGKCPSCKMPLATDQNQNLRGAEEAAESRRKACLAERKKLAADRRASRNSGEIRLPRPLLWGGCLVAGLLGAWLIHAAGQGGRPDSQARQFTYTCLSGNWDAALEFIEDDTVQQVEFKRWRSRYFPSILDAHRPAGDRVSLAVEAIEETDETRVLRVTLRSPHVGERAHRQYWARRDGKWLLDVVATLEDRLQPAAAD